MSAVSSKPQPAKTPKITKPSTDKAPHEPPPLSPLEAKSLPLAKGEPTAATPVPWNGWVGLAFIVALFYGSQFIAALLLLAYPMLQHWPSSQTEAWLNNAISAQFAYLLITAVICLGAIHLFLKRHGASWKTIGVRRPRASDFGWGLAMAPVYIFIFAVVVLVSQKLFPGLNIDQKQEIGFDHVHGLGQLLVTGISLIILPPLTEEIMVRGMLYGSLRKFFPAIGAMIVTSLIFGAAHLPEGGVAGPLYIAAIDTFILSIVLVYLRIRTNGLWASMTLHAAKNSLAFYLLYLASILPVLHAH